MAAPQSKTVVIVCPHCTTRYQVPSDTVGPKGRQVACAHCGKAWQAFAEKIIEVAAPAPLPAPRMVKAPPKEPEDRMFDAASEAELDAAFEAEQQAAADAAAGIEPPAPEPAVDPVRSIEEIKASIAPKAVPDAPPEEKPIDAQANSKRQKAFDKRQNSLTRQLPLARVRRTLRVTGLVTLVMLLGCGFSFRTEIVRLFPDLAGTYAALGLGVNIVGLEFRDVKTLLALRRGADVVQVDARIYSVAAGTVQMPPVVVTLLNDENLPLYQWSVAPTVSTLESGQVVDFTTQVTAPPPGATKVRLTFGSGGLQAPGAASPVSNTPVTPEPSQPAAPGALQPVHEEQAH
jgi:predicted Zn finger-like uncharacterized protein